MWWGKDHNAESITLENEKGKRAPQSLILPMQHFEIEGDTLFILPTTQSWASYFQKVTSVDLSHWMDPNYALKVIHWHSSLGLKAQKVVR